MMSLRGSVCSPQFEPVSQKVFTSVHFGVTYTELVSSQEARFWALGSDLRHQPLACSEMGDLDHVDLVFRTPIVR
jgi:hypothetical protein